jgi:hypothetical protein
VGLVAVVDFTLVKVFLIRQENVVMKLVMSSSPLAKI